MTKPLDPRVPVPSTEPAQPPLVLTPRVALAAALCTAVVSMLLALAFAPVKLPATARVSASHYSVQMVNYAFSPASITVSEGDTITWTNEDSAPHTVTTTSGPQSLNSPYLSKGQSWSFTFTAPGTYLYYCTVHRDMRAQVVVRAPAPATTAAAVPVRPTHAAQGVSQPTAAPTSAHAAASGNTASATASAGAALVAAPSSSASDAGATSQVQAQQVADSSIRTVSPVLLLAGLTATIAVFCLLLVASRAANARPAGTGSDRSREGGDDDYDY